MHTVHAEINRPLGANEVVKPASTLGRKVDHRRPPRRPVRYQLIWGKLVRRVNDSACALKPRLKMS
jgi:hypothetical protein